MPVKRAIRVYADTSVFGGAHDEEFQAPSRAFFDRVRQGRFHLVTSAVVRDEILGAPPEVQSLLAEMRKIAELADVTEEAVQLQQSYLNAGIVGPRRQTDALHVAVAAVSGCRIIVSWNFTHIVNFNKIPLYNGINQSLGYGVLGIHTPQEVIADEDQDV